MTDTLSMPFSLSVEPAALGLQFAAPLSARMADIQAHWQSIDPDAWHLSEVEALHRLVHGLTNAACMIGMQSVSDASLHLEIQLAAARDTGATPTGAHCQAIGKAVDVLGPCLERSLSFEAASPKPATHAPRMRSPLIGIVVGGPTTHADEQLAGTLRDNGYRARFFTNAADISDACTTLEAERPVAVMVDMQAEVATVAKAVPSAAFGSCRDSGIPLIAISAETDLQARLAALRAGASRYLTKPLDMACVTAMLDEVVDRPPSRRHRVMLVADDPLLLSVQATVLASANMDVCSVAEPSDFLGELDEFAPSVVVFNMYMAQATGHELASILKLVSGCRHLPVLVVSSRTEVSSKGPVCDPDPGDLSVRSVQPEHLVATVTQRARHTQQDAVHRDSLKTSLYEREREHLALNHHAIVSMADRNGNITYVNDKFCELSGYSREELLGQNHSLIQSGRHPAAFYQEMWSTIHRGDVWQGEICERHKQGALYWVASTITPFLGSDDEPYHYVSIHTDITPQKAAVAAISRQNVMQRIVSQATATLLGASVLRKDAAIEQVLRDTGEHLGADTACLFQLLPDGAHMSITHEWVSANVEPQRDQADKIPVDMASWWWKQISRKGKVSVPDVAALPLNAAAEKAVFEQRQAQSVFSLPLRQEGVIVGFVGYSTVHERRDWDAEELDLMKLVADSLSNAMTRWNFELALEQAAERLHRGQVFANIGTWDWNIETGELIWSECVWPLLGYAIGELESSYENFLNAVHPEDRQAVSDAVTACVEHDHPYEIEHRVVWPDGVERWLLERGAVLRDPGGKPLRMLGVVQDIDLRKRAELALATREAQLREAQSLAHIGDWQADLVTGKLIWSDEIYRIFGQQPDSFVPSVDAFLAAVHPDDRDTVRASEKRAVRTGHHDLVHRIVRPDGTVRYVRELAQAETDATGRLLRLAGTIQDVTERMETEQALLHARDEAEQASVAKSEFLSSMSHELRTPLNAILGFAQLLEYGEPLSDEQKDNLREISMAGSHLLQLIGELLDLARIEAGHVEAKLGPVDVYPIIEECLRLVRTQAGQRSIRIHHSSMQRAVVRADRTRLKQSLINLLSNAIKYNREGGSVRVDVQIIDGERLQILVSDTGHGIPAKRRNDLFQSFNRLDAESSDIEGTGIGLVLVRRMMALMNGTVSVRSKVGVGSTFILELPLESEHIRDDHHEQAADSLAPAKNDGFVEQTTVLYIEDNPANLKLVRQILKRRQNIRLIAATTPEHGIQMASIQRPDLILLDINLPGMDGYQVLEACKKDMRTKTIPIVAVTANAMPHDIERAKAAGFDEYLIKPLNLTRFYEVIDKFLRTDGTDSEESRR